MVPCFSKIHGNSLLCIWKCLSIHLYRISWQHSQKTHDQLCVLAFDISIQYNSYTGYKDSLKEYEGNTERQVGIYTLQLSLIQPLSMSPSLLPPFSFSYWRWSLNLGCTSGKCSYHWDTPSIICLPFCVLLLSHAFRGQKVKAETQLMEETERSICHISSWKIFHYSPEHEALIAQQNWLYFLKWTSELKQSFLLCILLEI